MRCCIFKITPLGPELARMATHQAGHGKQQAPKSAFCLPVVGCMCMGMAGCLAPHVQGGELPPLWGGATTLGIPCNMCKVNPMSCVRAAWHTSAEYDDPLCKRMCEQSSIHAHLQRVQGEPNVRACARAGTQVPNTRSFRITHGPGYQVFWLTKLQSVLRSKEPPSLQRVALLFPD